MTHLQKVLYSLDLKRTEFLNAITENTAMLLSVTCSDNHPISPVPLDNAKLTSTFANQMLGKNITKIIFDISNTLSFQWDKLK